MDRIELAKFDNTWEYKTLIAPMYLGAVIYFKSDKINTDRRIVIGRYRNLDWSYEGLICYNPKSKKLKRHKVTTIIETFIIEKFISKNELETLRLLYL